MANDIKVRCTPLPSHPLGPNSDIRLDSTKLCPARPNTHHLTSGRHGVCPDLQRELSGCHKTRRRPSPVSGRLQGKSGPSAQGSSTRVHNTYYPPPSSHMEEMGKAGFERGKAFCVFTFFARGRLVGLSGI